MNVLYLTARSDDVRFVENELGRFVPGLKLDHRPGSAEALQLLRSREYDAVLLDPILQDGSSGDFITRARREKPAIPLIVILGESDESPPLEALGAGADDYVRKRREFIHRLPGIILEAAARRKGEEERRSRPLRVLYAGDRSEARRLSEGMPLAYVEVAVRAEDGTLCGPDMSLYGPFSCDAVVIDQACSRGHFLDVLKDVRVRDPEIPAIVLADPQSAEDCRHALRLGAAACVVKAGDYALRLGFAVESSVRERSLERDMRVLASSEGRLRLLVESFPVGVVVLAGDGTVLAVNRAGLAEMGADRSDQVVGNNICLFVSPEQQTPLWGFIEKVCAGEKGSIRFECRGIDGSPSRLEFLAVPFRREAEGTPQLLGAMRDCGGEEDDRKASRERLVEFEQALGAALERLEDLQTENEAGRRELDAAAAPGESFRAAEEGLDRERQARAEAQEALQAALQELDEVRQANGQKRRELEESLQESEARQGRLLEEHRTLVARLDAVRQELDSRRRELEDQRGELETRLREEPQRAGTPAEMPPMTEEARRELEEARAARDSLEQALGEAEAREREMVGRFAAASQLWERSREELERKTSDREDLKNLLAETVARYRKLIEQGSAGYKQMLRKAVDRCREEADDQLQMLREQHFEERAMLEQFMSEAESREHRLDLRHREERRRLQDSLGQAEAARARLTSCGLVGSALAAPDGRLLECNEAFAHMFGYQGIAEALSSPADWKSRFVSDRTALDSRLRGEGRLDSAESRLRLPGGRTAWVLECAWTVAGGSPGDLHQEHLFVDVSGERLLREELRRHRRRESSGRLAHAAVETFDGLLSSMRNYSDLLVEGLASGDPRRRHAERLRQVAEQASSVAKRLLELSRSAEKPAEAVDLAALLNSMSGLLENLAGEDVDLRIETGSVSATVHADRREIEEVLTSFVVRARDALPAGGTVTIVAGTAPGLRGSDAHLPEAGVLLEISASGCGAQPVESSAALEAVASRCRACLRVVNEPGKGPSFRLYLP